MTAPAPSRNAAPAGVLDVLAARFEGREYVRQSPRDGLWYGIDRVLRCPVTEGHKTQSAAKAAWRMFEARAAADIATRRDCLAKV